MPKLRGRFGTDGKGHGKMLLLQGYQFNLVEKKDSVEVVAESDLNVKEEEDTESALAITGTVYVTADDVNIRTSPSTEDSSQIVGRASHGEAFSMIDCAEGWYVIDYYGTKAYINSDFVRTEEAAFEETVIPAAEEAAPSAGLSDQAAQDENPNQMVYPQPQGTFHRKHACLRIPRQGSA